MSVPKSTVVLAGHSGLRKTKVAERLVQAQVLCNRPDAAPKSVDLLNFLLESRLITSVQAFLDERDPARQAEVMRSGLERLAKDPSSDMLLLIHLSYMRDFRVTIPYALNSLKALKPRMIITLIDDVYDCWTRLKQAATRDRTFSFRLRDILAWRSLEASIADLFARNLRIPHHVVGVKHPVDMLRRVAFRAEPAIVYASFPITATRDSAESRKEIDDVRWDLNKIAPTLDPLTIDELPLLTEFGKVKDPAQDVDFNPSIHRWQLDHPAERLVVETQVPMRIPHSEIADLLPGGVRLDALRAQVQERDFRLVASAQIVAAYRPHYAKRPSRGMLAEINYALSKSKTIVTYWPKEDGDQDQFFSIPMISCSTYKEWIDTVRDKASMRRGEQA